MAGQAQAQTRVIENPSFEGGPTPGNYAIHSDTLHPGWISTDGTMETWADGFHSRDARDGDYLVELNPKSPVGLYQEICLISGESLSWDLYHAARGTSSSPDQTILYEVISLDGATTHQQLFSNTVFPMGSASNNNTLNLWDNVTGTTTYTGPTGVQRLQFRSTNAGGSGNFLDNIQIDLVPVVSFEGINTTDYENVNVNLPVLLVTGVVTSPLTIIVDATSASTAVEGTDYDFVTKTVTIPAGTYDGTTAASLYQIPLTIYEDGDYTEADETIIIELVSALAADPAFNPVIANDDCTVSAQSATIIHTILNQLLIESVAESFLPIDSAAGGATTSVLASDELNGAPVDPADVTLTVGVSDPELSLDPATGLISVAPGTQGGTYTVEYTICEIANPTNCSTVVETVTVSQPSLSMTKVADDTGPHMVGDVVTYTYTVVNDGDTTIRDIAITDTHNGSDPAPTPENETLLTDVTPIGDSTDAALDGSWDILAPGDTLTFTGTYTITQTDAENL